MIRMFLIAFIAASLSAEAVYNHPGIVAYREGEWKGSDHLLNLSDKIEVAVEVSQSEEKAADLNPAALEARIAKIFEKGGITPEASPQSGGPDLPLFHVLVMIYPIQSGYAFVVAGRLFEAIANPRIILDEGVTMQAITWDAHSINIASSVRFKEELDKAIDELALSFVKRYKFFENLKAQQK